MKRRKKSKFQVRKFLFPNVYEEEPIKNQEETENEHNSNKGEELPTPIIQTSEIFDQEVDDKNKENLKIKERQDKEEDTLEKSKLELREQIKEKSPEKENIQSETDQEQMVQTKLVSNNNQREIDKVLQEQEGE